MSRSIPRGLVAAFTLAVGMMLAAPSRALAYDCNALVVDDAGALGSDVAKVEAAAQKLESAGAYVRVRTVNDFGGFTDTDRYEADYEAHCQAWQDMNGGTKSNLLVFVVSFGGQRGAGLYYGDLWKKALDAQWNTVLTDEVVPRLRDGDASAALSAGLNGIGEIVAATKAARIAPTTGAAPVVVVQQPPAAPSQPTDLSGLWWVMGLGVLIVAVVLVVRAVLAARRREEERREAQQQARLSMQACVQHVTGNAEQDMALAGARLNADAANFSAADLAPLRKEVDDAKRHYAAAQTQYGELQASDANPDKNDLTTGQYKHLESRYADLLGEFRRIAGVIRGVDGKITELAALAASAQGDLDATGSAIEAAGGRIAAVREAGFRVDEAGGTLERSLDALARAEAAKDAKSFGQMKNELATANQLATQAADQAEAVQRGKAEIDAAIAQQRAEGQRIDQLIERAGGVFREISASYAPDSWSNINGNGSRAEQMTEDAETALDAAEAAASMETQNWTTARAQVDSASGNIRRAQALAEAIIVLKRDLDAAKEAAPREIDAAAADIRTAREYIARYDDDIDDGLETRLDDAERALGEAHRELAKDQPNYLTVVKAARAVNTTADGILAKARDEHETMERLRQRAATALREAERSVDAANNYIRSHHSEVDSDAERLAQSAESSLGLARRASTLNDQIRYADQSDGEADRALEMARRDVRQREEEREREARRQREAAEALVRAAAASHSHRSHSSSSGSSHSGGHGGGSVGWGGSSGGRSGGSVSVSGRGGRSGGSVGW